MYHGSVSLMRSKNQNLSYLHMFWSTCSIEGYISHVIAVQRLYAAVNVVCAVLVTMETDVREVCFNQTRFHISNTHFRMCHINTQAVCNSLYSRFGSTIYITSRISSITRHTTYIDYMTMITLHHTRYYQASHG